jgi:hypothetical protein
VPAHITLPGAEAISFVISSVCKRVSPTEILSLSGLLCYGYTSKISQINAG